MGWFSKEYDKHSHPDHMKGVNAKKAMKNAKRGTPEREAARKDYKMSKKEEAGFVKKLRQAGVQYAVDHSTGRIKNMKAFETVPEFYRRIRYGNCPCCNRPVARKGFVCKSCTSQVPTAEMMDKYYESMQTHTPSGKPIAGLTPGDPEWEHYYGPGGSRA